MTGILPVKKPAGFTSFDVIGKLRGVVKTRKIGHSGTLDPMATGVLPLFFGGATKVCDMLPNEDKRYVADIKFGIVTDTQDTTGRVLTETESRVTKTEFEHVISGFIGRQMQLPPMYSAVKVNGRPLYDLAREGKTVERAQKEIVVYNIVLKDFDEHEQTARIEVSCGKGTFIRTLIHDMGEKLGCGASMSALERTMAAGFDISECYTISEIEEMMQSGTFEEHLMPIERLFEDLPRLVLNDFDKRLYRSGVPLELRKRGWGGIEGNIAVFDESGMLLGISFMDEEANELKLRKMLNTDK
ncbi:MAG: tRNA pseudouridine(55) synthase TruB [Oscillospiraceae bacterium]|nr:tRNA pseudouridine(55) synthase TruB [Oscillospiraceae bacterium]MBQ3502015.1 tRNA pseudouridine(55) synthase TruB [Oscillospiraceae bacterium]MBQ4643303.1 tRNA pseudouridine(55) synthase TruB [Oscillospiraceae bacterium]